MYETELNKEVQKLLHDKSGAKDILKLLGKDLQSPITLAKQLYKN